MAALETAMEWVRPLVNTKPWDYCVIWKLGDDPSRFIEWGACCCGGGDTKTSKDEIAGSDYCRGSEVIKHLIKNKACRKLSQLPSVIPLYSGVHGDVVISKQPRWTVSPSSDDDEPNGTQVLIPIACGLIELFSTEHVPKDQKIIDYVSAPMELSLKQENTYSQSHPDFTLEEQLYLNYPSLSYLNYLPIPQPNNYSSFEGSSTCSSLSNEHQLLKMSSDRVLCISPEKSSKEYIDPPGKNMRQKRKKYISDCEFKESDAGVKITRPQKGEKGVYKSKNLVTERNRRKRIKDGMFSLRALVPKISKMDRASTLGDASDYIKELQETIDSYREELREMEEKDCKKPDTTNSTRNFPDKNIGSLEKAQPIEPQVEVSQLGTKDFLLKLIVAKQKRGGFLRLMETLDSLGLKVTDANVTTLNNSVLNVLRVEANTTEVEVDTLKHSLIRMVS